MSKETITTRVNPEIRQRIKELAQKENRTFANMLEVLILKALKIFESK